MAELPVLTYFDGRGRAEIIRIMLCAGKIKFNEVDMTERQDMLKLIGDGDLLYNQVPLLKIDGMKLVQTNAIINYVAAKGGLTGKDAKEKAMIDMYFEGTRDMYMPLLPMLFMGTEADTLAKAEPGIDKKLPIYEKILENSSSGFLVGSGLTMADIGLMDVLLSVVDYWGAKKFESYVNIKKYFDMVSNLDGISHYIKNVRKPKNTTAYVATVVKVLDLKF